jgi:Acyclic terpene utilisation family protein AtuA
LVSRKGAACDPRLDEGTDAAMPNLIYRVVSACGALGYGYPKSSLEAALEGRIDAIVTDGGSMDAGPYYLGTGTEYFEREAVKTDWRHMVEAGMKTGAPVILGSAGMAGGDRNLDYMVQVAKEVFAELGVQNAKVAVIGAELDPEIVIKEFRAGALRATGLGPTLSEEALRESVIVGQMGIHPLITALESGAQYVIAGRSCDIALFASDMIRRGIDPGIAYHVGHVLECGALACDPGSPSDCLVAEVYDDGSALFVAPNPDRRCTPYSIAAHSLYKESHPQLQFYPEGILVMENTEFFARDTRTAGIRKSQFVRSSRPWPWSIKLEGARRLGARKVSLLYIDPSICPSFRRMCSSMAETAFRLRRSPAMSANSASSSRRDRACGKALCCSQAF